MKKLILAVAFLLINIVLFSQQIPFQGRLVENGIPVTGNRTFRFEVTTPGVIWSEQHVGVNVVNGLYHLKLGELSPLNKTLFTGRDAVAIEVKVNGNVIDEFLLHKPFGQAWEYVNDTDIKFDGNVGIGTDEPARPLHVKGNSEIIRVQDGTRTGIEAKAYLSFFDAANTRFGYVGLGSSSSKDMYLTADEGAIRLSANGSSITYLSPTGNLGVGTTSTPQRLSVNGGLQLGNTTTNTDGAMRWTGTDFEGYNGSDWVSLTKGGDGEAFTVGSESEETIYTVSQTTENGAITTQSIWQSFVAANSAPLHSFVVDFATPTSTNVRIRLYEGQGTSGQVFYTETFPASQFNGNLGWRTLSLAANANISLESGKLYTLFIEGVSGNVTFSRHTGNPYPYGRMSSGASYDLKFRIQVIIQDTYNLEVDGSGAVVGGDLEAEGRIKDITGFVAPVGSVTAYAATITPEGWLRCDGTAVSRVKYKDLFDIIGTTWGAGDGSTTFNLPDLRGQFLRGVAYSTFEDPDKDNRIARYTGGATGNQVGSYQGDEFGSHSHFLARNTAVTVSSPSDGYTGSIADLRVNQYHLGGSSEVPNIFLSSSEGGSETRPKNAYVNFIIKY